MSGVPTSLAVSLIRATKKRSFTTPTTLIVLLLYPQPVLAPLGKVGQRREVTHAVEVDTGMEMIRLVLDDPREELLGHAVDARPLAIVAFEADRGEPGDHATHVGDGEAAFPSVLHLLRHRRDYGVDEHGEGDGRRVGVARIALHLDHADLLEHVHLGRGQPRPVVLAHGLHEVVDEALRFGRPDLVEGHGQRRLAQHWMSEASHLEYGHIRDPLPASVTRPPEPDRRLRTLKATTGWAKPLRTSSPMGSTVTKCSRADTSGCGMRICPGLASAQRRAARFDTEPMAP